MNPVCSLRQLAPNSMTEPTDPKPELEIKSDADWKQRVKAEAAQLDAERAEQQTETAETVAAAPDGSAPDSDSTSHAASAADVDLAEIPPADFTMLVSMFSTQAMVALGVIPNPADGKAEANFPLARHFIDLLGILQEKTRRNLTGHESQLLEQSLHELRLAYVELSRSGGSTDPSG
jgi:hypothetical protein